MLSGEATNTNYIVFGPDASRQLLQLLTSKTIDYLVAQVKAGAQVCIKMFCHFVGYQF
jgi:uroporphyrinogen-III decarboxylase